MATKSPNVLKPILLAVVLCALGGTAYWLEYGKKPKDAAAEADGKKVLLIAKKPVALLEFRGASAKPELADKLPLAVTLACESLKEKLCRPDDASNWSMLAPLKTKADDSTTNSVLRNFGNLVSNETIDLSMETPEKRAQLLKDYGLDAAARANPATRRVSVTLEGAKKITAYFGVRHPIGENVFALVQEGESADENKVFVVPDWQLTIFDQKTSYFRDKNLFAINEKDISKFTLAVSKKIPGKLEAKRMSDNKGWTLAAGKLEVEGDVDMVDGVLAGITHLAAKDILAENQGATEAKTALAGAKLVYDIRFTAKSAEKWLRLYEKKGPKAAVPKVYAIVYGQDPVYEIDNYMSDKLERTLDELRIGKLLSTSERYSLTAIEIEARGREAFKQRVAKSTGGEWKVGSLPTAPGKVENLLDRLSSKIVTTYSGKPPSGEVLKMSFRKTVDAKDYTVLDLEFWTVDGRLYARNPGTTKKEVVELATDFGQTLPWKSSTFTDAPGAPK